MYLAEKEFTESWRFVHEFGRLPFDAYFLDGCVQFEDELFEISWQKLKNPLDLMWQEQIQLSQPPQKQMLD